MMNERQAFIIHFLFSHPFLFEKTDTHKQNAPMQELLRRGVSRFILLYKYILGQSIKGFLYAG